MKQARPSECVSDLGFDAWFADELAQEAASQLNEHVAGCERCRARQAALGAFHLRFTNAPRGLRPQLQAALRIEQRPRRDAQLLSGPSTKATPLRAARAQPRWLLIGGLGLALAAAAASAMVAFLPVGSNGERSAGGERSKGGESVSFFVKRGERVQRGARQQRVRPGDKLRFVYTAARARYLAILSLDGAGNASVYYPAAERAASVAPGVDVALPSAIELDGVLGEERVLTLFCDQPIALAPLRAQLAAGAHAFSPPPGCSLDQLTLIKEPLTSEPLNRNSAQ